MKLSNFGAIQIAVTPHADNPEIMSVDIGAQNRIETISMMTNKDETVDQFCQRLRSMMRSLWNSEPRQTQPVKTAEEAKKALTWDQERKTLQDKSSRMPLI